MALLKDEFGERTEQPTPLRMAEARRRGRVARSADLVSVALLGGGACALAMCGSGLLAALTKMTERFLGSAGASGSALAPAREALGTVLWTVAPIVLVPLGAVILINLIQFGPLASVDPLKPDLGRISPVMGLRRLFSGRSLVRTGLSVGKIIAIATVCLVTIRHALPGLVSAAVRSPREIAAALAKAAGHLSLRVILVLGFLAVIDWMYQRWEHRRDLRITRRELVDDLRRMEGDRRVAARMRARSKQLASQRLAGEMPLAGAVIASPGGPAVAVRFDETMSAPCVVGRGRDYLAARIRRLGRAHGVTMVEDAKLAGAIYRLCRVGDEIPRKLYERVAEILAFAEQTRVEE